MAHDVAVNVFYTNRVKQTINNDTPVDDGMNDDASNEVHFDDDEKSEIISIVFSEMCDRLKV